MRTGPYRSFPTKPRSHDLALLARTLDTSADVCASLVAMLDKVRTLDLTPAEREALVPGINEARQFITEARALVARVQETYA